MLLDINGPEFVLLLVIAIILFGPERLPEFARKAARVLRYVRDHGRHRPGAAEQGARPGVRGPGLSATSTRRRSSRST